MTENKLLAIGISLASLACILNTANLVLSKHSPEEREYACQTDSFYGIAECFPVLDSAQCNDDPTLMKVRTPYATDWEKDAEGEYVEIPSKDPELCLQKKNYTLTRGHAEIVGFEI